MNSEVMEVGVPEDERVALLHGSAEMVQLVQHLEVTDAVSLEVAGGYRRHARQCLQAIEAKVGARVKAVYDAWRSLKDMQNELERPWDEVVMQCSVLIGSYEVKQRQAARIAEAAAARARREAEVEAARLHAQQLAAAKAAAEAQRAQEAGALLEAGDDEGAALALAAPARPATVVPPQPAVQPPLVVAPRWRATGTSVAVPYKARLLNLDQLVVAAAADPTLRGLLQYNEAAGNAMAKAMGARMAVPGLEVYEAPQVRQR